MCFMSFITNPRYRMTDVAASPGGIPEYDDGATMDAAVGAGDVVALVGATTGGTIAVLRCATIGPVTYDLLGPIDLRESYQGSEFTGVIAFEALGTGTLPDWASSTPGSATVGGPRLAGTGTCKITGLRPIDGRMGPYIRCSGYLAALSAGVTGDCIMVGMVSDSSDTLVQCGGLYKTGSGHACACGGDQAVDAPAPTANSNFPTTPDISERWDLQFSFHRYVAGGAIITGAATNTEEYGARASIADTINAQAALTDFQPALAIVGTWAYHVNVIEIAVGVA